MAVAPGTQYAAIRDNILAELAGETSRRAALVAAGNPAPATYQVGGKTVRWTEYMTAMADLAEKYNQLAIASGGDGGIIEECVHGYS